MAGRQRGFFIICPISHIWQHLLHNYTLLIYHGIDALHSAAEKSKLEADVVKIQSDQKALEEEAGEAYVLRGQREAAVEANKSELEAARAEVRCRL